MKIKVNDVEIEVVGECERVEIDGNKVIIVPKKEMQTWWGTRTISSDQNNYTWYWPKFPNSSSNVYYEFDKVPEAVYNGSNAK